MKKTGEKKWKAMKIEFISENSDYNDRDLGYFVGIVFLHTYH